MAVDGLIAIKSSFGPEETMKRFEAEVSARGMTVFAHVDHAAGAAAVGMSLQLTDLLIFGNVTRPSVARTIADEMKLLGAVSAANGSA